MNSKSKALFSHTVLIVALLAAGAHSQMAKRVPEPTASASTTVAQPKLRTAVAPAQMAQTPAIRQFKAALKIQSLATLPTAPRVGNPSSLVREICWYPRNSSGKPYFFITARVGKAKKITFFYHKRPQRGLHQGQNFSTNYQVSQAAFNKAMRQPSNVPGIGKVSLHITLRSNQHFVYTTEPYTCPF